MDPLRNPFSPGAGSPPPELAGREEILKKALLALARIKRGRTEKSMFLIGLRGVGKTVLLNEIASLATGEGYKAVMVEAHEKKSLPELLYPHLRQLLFSLDGGKHVSEQVKRARRVLVSFFKSIKLKAGELELSFDADPETGTADSGDLESDLAEVFISIGEAAKDRQTAVAIIVDELQYLDETELSSLIMAVHRISQRSLPLIVIGAGLPQLVGKCGSSKSYSERLFDYPNVGPLLVDDAIKALQEPARQEGAIFTSEALQEIVRVTEGYPYFLQEWGYHAWNLSPGEEITFDVIDEVNGAAIRRLDENFFRVRFDRLTPTEKRYLRALAELGADPQRSGEIAKMLGKGVSSVAPIRSQLISKGMIYSPTHGDTAFTVPLFDQFLKRIIPQV